MLRKLLSHPDIKTVKFKVGNLYVIKGSLGNGLIVLGDDGHTYIILESRFE